MKILLSLNLLLVVNIVMNSCPLFGLHMGMKQIFIACHFRHSILLIKSIGSIIMEVLNVFTFMCTTFMKLKCST